jgi:hypothetical protein
MQTSITRCRCRNMTLASTRRQIFASSAYRSADPSWITGKRSRGVSFADGIGPVLAIGDDCARAYNKCGAARICHREWRDTSRVIARGFACGVLGGGQRIGWGTVQLGRGLNIVDELSKGLGGRFVQKFGTGSSASILVLQRGAAKTAETRTRQGMGRPQAASGVVISVTTE